MKQPPDRPRPPSGRLVACLVPSWMYGDPAAVVERLELTEIAQAERVRRRKYGLLSKGTVRLIKRMRIRELVANAMRGER